jgi:hypothetical protein
MLLNVPAQVQKLVRDRTQFDAYTRASFRLLELLHKMRVFHERKTVADALRVENYRIVKIRLVGVSRASSI